ncbi:hypothetical protein [Streptomyces sp. NPDC053720]|uniref:hypothetical protein n=1 Tax=Streptomyces sp. NPDC053720 TaxID=3154855 RepID=UPI003414175B
MSSSSAVYNWADDEPMTPPRPVVVPPEPQTPPQMPPQMPPRQAGPSRAEKVAGAAGAAAGNFVGGLGSGLLPPVNVHIGGGGNNSGGGNNGGGNGGGAAGGGGADRHQGDRLIYMVERIEIRSDKDILALGKAINRLGRELHLILGMRAEEIEGVLSTYKGKWYTFGAGSRIKARLVSAHLKVSAEAAKALGVGALKMSHAFDRHFVQPEREARERKTGKKPKREFTIGGE